MRRLSLLCAAVLLGLVAFASTAQATAPGGAHAASLRQAGNPYDTDGDGIDNDRDACPNQYGTAVDQTTGPNGCPDADGDTVADSLDKCPTQKGNPPKGCAGVKIVAEGFLRNGAGLRAECSAGNCVPRGVAVLRLTKASRRALHVHSSLIGRFPFVKNCGGGVRCAIQHLSPTLRKKAKAHQKAFEKKHHGADAYLSVTLSAEMTYPRNETLTKNIRLIYGEVGNTDSITLCDPFYSGSSCSSKPYQGD